MTSCSITVKQGLEKQSTMSDNHGVLEPSSSGTAEDSQHTNGFSEHELIDIMYAACNADNTGEVLVSSIIQYLQTLTIQNAHQDRLTALRRLLDPDRQNPHVSREAFHSTMREWIAQRHQDSSDPDDCHFSWPDSSEVPVNELELSISESRNLPSKVHQCSCDGPDLPGEVAELNLANRKLSEQNSSLLRMLAQCEDVNLQLSLEITELQAKLISAQRSAIRTRTLTEELEETRLMLKEAQENSSLSQRSFTELVNETELLKVHIRRLEEKNKKLIFEQSHSEESLSELRRVNTELKAEYEETLLTLMLKNREITKSDVFMEKMKNSHVENHKIIEVLQSELSRLQEHSNQILMRLDRQFDNSQSLRGLNPPNHRSLLSEMQEQHDRALHEKNIPSLHKHIDDIQSIIHRIKREEVAHHLHDKDLEKDPSFVSLHSLQPKTIKLQFSNVQQELEQFKSVWEEREEKVEEQQKAWAKEQKQSQTGSQTQIQEAKKVAAVNRWRAHDVDEAKTCAEDADVLLELTQQQTKLLQAEDVMRKHLQASVISGQVCEELKHTSGFSHTDRGNDTGKREEEITVEKVVKDVRDAAEVKESDPEQKQTQLQVTTGGLLGTLGRIEAMVSSALEKAELVRQSEQRVNQVRQRMESITQRVEEATIVEKRASQPPGLGLPADPESGFTEDVAPEKISGTERPPLSPDFLEVTKPPQSMNGATGRGSCCGELQPEEKLLQQEFSSKQGDRKSKQSCEALVAAGRPFLFPYARSRPSQPFVMPMLPEEDEDSPEEMDSSSSSPITSTPGESQAIIMTAPTIIYPQQSVFVQQEGRPLEQNRPHSPRARQARNSTGGPITTVDSTGNVIDLVKDQLPELQLSEEDRQKNLELLEQAKKASDRFLTRRGRRSTSSLTDSPTGLSPPPTASTSPCSSRSSSSIMAPQTAAGTSETTQISSQSLTQRLENHSAREQPDLSTQDLEDDVLVDWKPTEKRKVSSGTLTPRFAVQKENRDLPDPTSFQTVLKADEVSGRNQNPAPATGVAKPVPRPPTQQAPCTAEIKTIGAFPPLMRAVSWDAVSSLNPRTGASSLPPTAEETFSNKPRDGAFKTPGYKDFPIQPGSKLSKLREEHKLMRNQSIVGSKLPDLSEAAEQEKGSPSSLNKSTGAEETKDKYDSMPNISDVMLRKLKLHRGLPGCAPPLTEKEVENAFVQLSLAFRNDNYTLETRLKQAERERNLTEEDAEKELGEFKDGLKMTASQWHNMEQREAYQHLIETVAVLIRLTTRLSSRAEIVGAVRQEKRMNKATEVMMQYVENLKRMYEKDHAELMEFKKLANQNSHRYGGSPDPGDDGVPRPSRSLSLTLGKAMPRRRVSVAVVPKFFNVPSQTAAPAGPGSAAGPTLGAALPVLCEAGDVKSRPSTEAAQPAAESGKSVPEQEGEPAKHSVNLEEIRAEIKAKIEEEAYNKGYQEGLKHSKALLEEKCDDESDTEKQLELKHKDEESGKRYKSSRRIVEVLALLDQFCPKISATRRFLWIFLMLFVVMCVVISIFTFFSDYYNRREDT